MSWFSESTTTQSCHDKIEAVVMVTSGKWGARWDRPQAMAQAFLEHGIAVYFVEILVSIRQTRAVVGYNPIRWRFPNIYSPISNLTVVSLGIVPPIRGITAGLSYRLGTTLGCRAFQDVISNKLIPEGLHCIIHNPWTWPVVKPFVDHFRSISYDVMDDWFALAGGGLADSCGLRAIEADLIHRADILLTVSDTLQKQMKEQGRDAFVVRNGVDASRFETGASDFFAQYDFARPLIGFVGALGHWIDVDLISAVAKAYPQGTVILIGPIDVSISKLLDLPNVRALGAFPYEAIPSIMHDFDVCLNPFRRTPAGNAADPIKVYEYLATGKPVVSTDMIELRHLGDVLYLAGTTSQFVDAVHSAISEAPSMAVRRRQVARANSWCERSGRVLSILEQHDLAGQSQGESRHR